METEKIQNAKVIWNGNLSFTGTADTGYELPLDGKKEVGGGGAGFRPMELIAAGLAGCTAMDVISILSKKRQDVTAFEVRVRAGRASEHPKVFTQATIEYHVAGHSIDEKAVLRAMELSATRYCPAQAMLGQVMPIGLEYFIYEVDADGEQSLQTQGSLDQQALNTQAQP
ncbi:MAG TPA: OsmC family protein [Anaerolineales bacterium]|nr:OsmC family protein [Anaerolineales bacterium]